MANEKKAGKKKKLPKSFIYAFVFLVVIPATTLIGWYILTVILDVAGSDKTAEDLIAEQIAKTQAAIMSEIVQRAESEGFQVEQFERCSQLEDQYRLPTGYIYTEFTQKELLGLPGTATDAQMRERCVVFAKIVAEMQKLSHQDRHLFVCQGSEFATDESGQFVMFPDPEGYGVIMRSKGQEERIAIPRGSHTLVKSWQIFNIGDGCMVVGLSKSGVFSMSGSVKTKTRSESELENELGSGAGTGSDDTASPDTSDDTQ